MSEVPVDRVSGPRMMRELAEFAAWVKLSGTEEELVAVRWLEARMRDAGFRTEILMHDAYISLPLEGKVAVDGRALKAITHSFSRPTPPGGLSGVPIYLADGSEAAFARLDLAGRILLVEGMATPAVADRARRVGAAAQLHISHHEHLHEMCISPVWGSPSPATLGLLPTTVACTVSAADGGAIRDALAAGAAPRVTLESRVDTGWRKTPLLVAELDAPADPGGAFVLVSGHQDSWYYGVMDNGSANLGMIEVARICAARRAEWRRGLRVCFWSGHSHGRYSGSTWYADTFHDELSARCVAHVNVDSLGGIGATELSHAAAMAELRHLATEAVQAETNLPHHGKRKARNSDESFGGIGIPSMFGAISEQAESHARARNHLGWWWHTPEDLIDKVDEAFLVRDTRVLTRAVWRLLADRVVPLDHAATLEGLLRELDAVRVPLAGRLPIDSLHAEAKALHDRATHVLRRMQEAPDSALGALNSSLIGVSRALVPVDYHQGDRFAHPPALPLPDWAVLQPLRDLAATEPGSEAERFAWVEAMRARNRLAGALREARAALDAGAAALPP